GDERGPGRWALQVLFRETVTLQDVLDERDVHGIARMTGAGHGQLDQRQLHAGLQGALGLGRFGRRADEELAVDITEPGDELTVAVDDRHGSGVVLLGQPRAVGPGQRLVVERYV